MGTKRELWAQVSARITAEIGRKTLGWQALGSRWGRARRMVGCREAISGRMRPGPRCRRSTALTRGRRTIGVAEGDRRAARALRDAALGAGLHGAAGASEPARQEGKLFASELYRRQSRQRYRSRPELVGEPRRCPRWFVLLPWAPHQALLAAVVPGQNARVKPKNFLGVVRIALEDLEAESHLVTGLEQKHVLIAENSFDAPQTPT